MSTEADDFAYAVAGATPIHWTLRSCFRDDTGRRKRIASFEAGADVARGSPHNIVFMV